MIDNRPWLKDLVKLPNKLPADVAGQDDLYDLMFFPYKTIGKLMGGAGSGTSVEPFKLLGDNKIPVTFSTIYDSKANYVIGITNVPSATITMTPGPGTEKGEYWNITKDRVKLKLELLKITQGGQIGADYYSRVIGHIHLHMLTDIEAKQVAYAFCRNPYYIDNFLRELNNTVIDPDYMKFIEGKSKENFFQKSRKSIYSLFKFKLKKEKSAKPGLGIHGVQKKFDVFGGGYSVDNNVIVIVSTSAAGTGADPCIKLVGYIHPDSGNFVVQQVIVMPYATP